MKLFPWSKSTTPLTPEEEGNVAAFARSRRRAFWAIVLVIAAAAFGYWAGNPGAYGLSRAGTPRVFIATAVLAVSVILALMARPRCPSCGIVPGGRYWNSVTFCPKCRIRLRK